MTPISDDMVERACRAVVKIGNQNGEWVLPADEWTRDTFECHGIWSEQLAALIAALEGSVAVPVELTQYDLNSILGRSVICSPTPMTFMFRDFHAAMVKYYSGALPRQDRGDAVE